MSGTIAGPRARTHGFVALMLLTAGALVLAGRVLPVAGDALALVLGIELLGWARADRAEGPLIAGGVMAGVGTGVLLAAGPLLGADAHAVGAAFLLAVAGGFAVVAALSRWWLARPQTWAWLTALTVGTIGAGLLGGPAALGEVLTWALPAALLAGGGLVAARWLRA